MLNRKRRRLLPLWPNCVRVYPFTTEGGWQLDESRYFRELVLAMDTLTPAQRSERMRLVRSRDTKPEVAFRQGVWRKGLRFRVCDSRLPGKPDLVFPRHRLAVFIDGDFWHGNQWRTRRLLSLDAQFTGARNGDYWRAKIRRNTHRDFAATAAILELGWRVIRFWESDISRDLEGCIDMTVAAVKTGQSRAPQSIAGRKVGEFFAGIGLVRLALENRGWTVALANDFDEQKAVMYRQNFGDDHLSTGDIHELPVSAIPDCALFTASFPCNDLSIAGSMSGLNGKQSGAFWGFVRILEKLGERRPPLILLENVVGFLMANEGRDFETALLSLNKLGYACDAFILNASSFAPQSRARLFVVAKKQPKSARHNFQSDCAVRPAVLAEFICSHPNIEWDVRPLPAPPAPTARLEEIVEDLPDDALEWWDHERTEYFMAQLSDRHLEVAQKMIAGRRASYATAFRRVRKGRSMAELRSDGIAGCLRTPRGGSGRQILFKAGKGRYQVRLMTPRECARLQGVPDTYKIEVRSNQALFGFGDAVCVPVIEWIADNYLNPVASEMLRGKLLT